MSRLPEDPPRKCLFCKAPARESFALCEKHAERARERSRRAYREAKAKAVCVDCGEKVEAGKPRCDDCRVVSSERSRQCHIWKRWDAKAAKIGWEKLIG